MMKLEDAGLKIHIRTSSPIHDCITELSNMELVHYERDPPNRFIKGLSTYTNLRTGATISMQFEVHKLYPWHATRIIHKDKSGKHVTNGVCI